MPVNLGLMSLAGAPTDGVNEVQTIVLTGTPTGGTFTISWSGQTTAAIAYNATAAVVQAALEALSNIAVGDVVCTGGPLPGTTVTITFGGELAGLDNAEITATTTNLTVTDPTTVAIATTVPGVAATTNEQQTVTLTGNPTGGTFTLTWSGQTTAGIAYDASAATVDAALEALSNIGVADVTCSGGPLPAAVTVEFTTLLGLADQPQMTANGASLTHVLGKTITTETAGVRASFRGAPNGTILQDTTNGILYQNTGTELTPVWDDVSTLTTWS